MSDKNQNTQTDLVSKRPMVSHYANAVRLVCIAAISLAILIQHNQLMVNMMLIIATVLLFGISFANGRGESVNAITLLATALLLTLLLPIDLTWWQVILFSSFGIVLGEQIFGGRGYSFVSPVICGLAFYHFSYEVALPAPVDDLHILWPGIAALLLLAVNAIDWRVTSTLIACITVMALLFSTDLPLPSTAVAVCIVYAGVDTAIQPKSRAGRWLYGVFFGVFLFLLNPGLNDLNKTISACLLASIVVPLIDSMMQALHKRTAQQPGEQHVSQ